MLALYSRARGTVLAFLFLMTTSRKVRQRQTTRQTRAGLMTNNVLLSSSRRSRSVRVQNLTPRHDHWSTNISQLPKKRLKTSSIVIHFWSRVSDDLLHDAKKIKKIFSPRSHCCGPLSTISKGIIFFVYIWQTITKNWQRSFISSFYRNALLARNLVHLYRHSGGRSLAPCSARQYEYGHQYDFCHFSTRELHDWNVARSLAGHL